MNALRDQYGQEIDRILAKYPAEWKRSAVMPLLYLAQRAEGYITARALRDIAEICEISITDVASIVGFYTLYYDQPLGRYHIQVCTDLPCALRGAEEFLAQLSQKLGIQPGQTSTDGLFHLEQVMCLGACHRAPVFQVQGDGEIVFHENQSVETALAVIEALREHARQETGGAA